MQEQYIVMLITRTWLASPNTPGSIESTQFLQTFQCMRAQSRHFLCFMLEWVSETRCQVRLLFAPANHNIVSVFHLYRCITRSFTHADAMGLFTKCTRMAKQSTKHGVQSLINVHITDGRYIHTIQTKCLYSYKLQFTLYPTISVHHIIP